MSSSLVSIYLIQIFYLILIVTTSKAQKSCITPSYEEGLCVSYRDCPYVKELNKRFGSQLPQHFTDYIFRSKCSNDNEPIRLCCKMKDFSPKPLAPDGMGSRFNDDLNTDQDLLSQVNRQGFDILNNLACGAKNGNKVAGGTETDLEEFPWMALLRFDVPGDQYLCGGSLITNRFVLTAAHCVNSAVKPVIGVRLGEHDISTNEDCQLKGYHKVCNPPVEDFGIEQIISHPSYSERNRVNDIALLKLDRDVEFKSHIKPVCLPITPDALQIKTKDGFSIAGWGSTEKGTKSMVLLSARLDSQERSTCQDVYRIEMNHRHLCAGDLNTGRDTCRGDSGGPLLQFGKYKQVKRYIQYGIVAAGGLACNLAQSLPGIYTNVINFLPWITNNIVV